GGMVMVITSPRVGSPPQRNRRVHRTRDLKDIRAALRGSRQGGALMTAGNFKAMAHRSEGWWALEVTGDDLPYPAYTQARRLDQAEVVVRDLLAVHFGTSEDAVGQIKIVPVLDA